MECLLDQLITLDVLLFLVLVWMPVGAAISAGGDLRDREAAGQSHHVVKTGGL